jgi:hypothetical protein
MKTLLNTLELLTSIEGIILLISVFLATTRLISIALEENVIEHYLVVFVSLYAIKETFYKILDKEGE